MRIVASLVAAACLVLTACESPVTRSIAPGNASTIVHGTVSGAPHPAVVLVVLDVAGVPTFRCSGTVIKPKLVLTAGHCAGEPGEFSGMRVFTESDVEHGNNNYPFNGPNTVPATGWHSHPLFTEALFFLHDVGVIELRDPIVLPASEYGQVPTVNQLDELQKAHSPTFTTVGYGVQRINPVKVIEELIRMEAEPHLISINTPRLGHFAMTLSNNASTGGSCFGDSGGPNYLGSSNVIAGLTSFSLTGNCGGIGGVFRLDARDVLDFLAPYLAK